jgi:hypothetical protein
MTECQIYIFTCAALVMTIFVAVLTRATVRRIVGATVGAAVCGPVGLGIIAFSERVGWWHMAIPREPFLLTLLWINVALCGYVFLITWRIARRFGGRGLILALCVSAVIGPFRDSWYMAKFPEWGFYAPGVAPMLAISGAYVLLGIVGHGSMRLIAGLAEADRLARPLWKHT